MSEEKENDLMPEWDENEEDVLLQGQMWVYTLWATGKRCCFLEAYWQLYWFMVFIQKCYFRNEVHSENIG